MAGEIGGMLWIEAELQKERASALRKVGERLDSLIAQLQPLHARIVASSRPTEEEVAEYRRLHAQAHEQRYQMMVQREAMGLRNHGTMDEVYPIPPPLPRQS